MSVSRTRQRQAIEARGTVEVAALNSLNGNEFAG
jgi:hypothetical protein